MLYLFKGRRFSLHDCPFFIQRQVSDLVQRVVHIRVVIRVGQGAPIRKEHVHDGHAFAHRFRSAYRSAFLIMIIDPFFHADEVFLKRFHIGIMLVDGFARDPRTHEPTRVPERPPRIRAIRFAEFVAAGAMHPKGTPASFGALRFQAKPPNGGQRFIQGLAKIRHACTTEPVPLLEAFGEFAVNVVTRSLHVAAQVALGCHDEAHVHGRRQNAGTVPVNFTLVVHSRVNGAVRQFMIAQPVLRDQFGRVAQMQR